MELCLQVPMIEEEEMAQSLLIGTSTLMEIVAAAVVLPVDGGHWICSRKVKDHHEVMSGIVNRACFSVK